jgi:hypothetical protein
MHFLLHILFYSYISGCPRRATTFLLHILFYSYIFGCPRRATTRRTHLRSSTTLLTRSWRTQFPMLTFRQKWVLQGCPWPGNEQEDGFLSNLLNRGAIQPGKYFLVFLYSIFHIGCHMSHWLQLCSGGNSVVQKPQGVLLRILQALVFNCFEGEIHAEETQPWKRPKAQIWHWCACPPVTTHGKILCFKCYIYVCCHATYSEQ